MSPPVVGRLAPSPTGLLHLGHARSFLLAWWSVRARRGRIVLRIEDLDGPRVQPQFIAAAQRDLEWLGLDWNGSAVLSSQRVELLRAAVDRLVAAGAAYPCVCTRSEIRAAMSAPHGTQGEVPYPGTCRGRFVSLEEAEQASGRDAGLRFVVRPGPVVFEDAVFGEQRVDVAGEAGDFLIARRDKTPAYQLAVVVEDAHDGITEVLRGDDLLTSAARQWLLQEALALPHPRWVHVPLVTDETGRRLAKRADDLSLAQLRQDGVDPRAIVAWVAASAGLEVPGRVRAEDVVAAFDLSRLPHSAVALDPAVVRSWRSA